jgi:uncharacterized protein YyaL (SSP411 family)
MQQKDGSLLHRFRHGDAAVTGQLDDYAFMIFASLELYLTTHDEQWLKQSIELASKTDDLFGDKNGGAFFMSPPQTKDLLIRPKDFYDGAVPSGNSMMVYNLARLSKITGNVKFAEKAQSLANTFRSKVKKNPQAHTLFLTGWQFATGTTAELVVAGEKNERITNEMISVADSYQPGLVAILKTGDNSRRLAALAPYTKDQVALGGKSTAYVCVNNACSFPVHSKEKLIELINKKLPPVKKK